MFTYLSTLTARRGYDGEEGVWRWGKREIIYLSLHCHLQNDSCIKMGSDESHFLMFHNCEGQSHKTVSTNHNLFEEKTEPEAESSRGSFAHQPNAIPLDQSGSLRVDNDLKLKFIAFLCLQCCAALAEWRPVIRTEWLNISIIVWQRCLT